MTDASAFAAHAVDQLRAECRQTSRRPFQARGIALQRCDTCLLGQRQCICAWRQPGTCPLDFVLIMHRNEVFKPTNTGRLVADLFPNQCRAYLWDRLQPDPGLLQLLRDPKRRCALVFPPRPGVPARPLIATEPGDTRRLTLFLLDGTWKQASKMAARSAWLQELPRLDLGPELARHDGGYRLRDGGEAARLSTAEAAALCLRSCAAASKAQILLDYFSVFNEHYLAARLNRAPAALPAHGRLSGDPQHADPSF